MISKMVWNLLTSGESLANISEVPSNSCLRLLLELENSLNCILEMEERKISLYYSLNSISIF